MRSLPRTISVSVATALGLLVGVRATFAMSIAGPVVFLEPWLLPVEEFGISWSTLAAWPRDFQLSGVLRLVPSVAALFAAASGLATLNAVTLLAEGSAARGGESAIRAALGASPVALFSHLVRELRALLLGAFGLGSVAGLAAGLALRAAWPGTTTSPLSVAPLDLALLTALLFVAIVVSHTRGALRAASSGRAAGHLRAGRRAGADPAAVFARRALSALHVAMTAAVLVGVSALSSRQVSQASATPTDGLTVVEAFAPDPDLWAPAIAALRAAPAVVAESLAAPGALVGLGVHDIVVTECGACSIGGLPTPLWNARAEHHVVGPGFFDLAGIPVVDGRGFRLEDGPGEERVALVSRRLANTAFEEGHAIGRRLRVGNDVDVWYRIVGVVEDRMVPTLGEDGRPRGAVYLSAEQHPLRHAAVLLRGDPAAVERAVGSLAGHGIEVWAARPAAEHLARAALPLAWARWTLVALSLLSLVIAAHGVYLTALQTTRRQARDIGLRVALGASPGAIVRLCLVDRTRTTLWGLAGGALLGAFVSAGIQAASGAPGAGLSGYLAVGALLLTLSVAAAWRAVGEALAVDPTRLLD